MRVIFLDPRHLGTIGFIGVCALVGCASILGIQDTKDDAIAADGGGGAESDAQVDGGDGSVPIPVADTTGCETEKPNEAVGVFVSTKGSTAPGCGTSTTPCKTIQLALAATAA